MKQLIDLYFDKTVRKALTLIELALLVRVIVITINLDFWPIASLAIVVFLSLLVIDRLVALWLQINTMLHHSPAGKSAQHMLECYLGPIFRMPRRIAGILFAIYALAVIATLPTIAFVQVFVMIIATLLLISHIFGLYLSLSMRSSGDVNRP